MRSRRPVAEPAAARASNRFPVRAAPRRPGRDGGLRPPRGTAGSIIVSVLPGLALFVTFFVVPLAMLTVTAFSNWSGFGFQFLGPDNFTAMVQDPTFWKAALNTILYVAAGVFIEVPLGVLAGMILAQHLPGWRIFRTVLFAPFVISGAAYALVFALFYNPRYGLLNSTLGLVGLNRDQDWLFSTDSALPAIAGTFVFIIGVAMVLVMAEIASIPHELYEAAEVDGASPLQSQVAITLPLLRNVIGTIVLITLLGYLALFDIVFILTKGGPNDSTVTLALYAYRAYVNNAWGYASAVGVMIVFVGLLLIMGVRRLFRLGERTL